MTQNNADASAVSEGEMTANALLEALGTTLEPDLLVEAHPPLLLARESGRKKLRTFGIPWRRRA